MRIFIYSSRFKPIRMCMVFMRSMWFMQSAYVTEEELQVNKK